VHRTVSCNLTADVLAPATLDLQLVVATGEQRRDERLRVTSDGQPLDPVELAAPHGGRLHTLQVAAGRLEVSYRCTVEGGREVAAPAPLDRALYLRPSRYAESDRLAALAAAELGDVTDPFALLRAVRGWVGGRLAYVSGSSRGTDGAVDTALAGAGVCRDYAHLAVALLRARDVPARVVSVYAPGLSPMDFHAVVEALVDGAWWVVDATGLAPRRSFVRIATGRDAADTAFLSSYGGIVRLDGMAVSAVVDGDLPCEDEDELLQLA
jgi:transglutaminase-like putative cysteine protease